MPAASPPPGAKPCPQARSPVPRHGGRPRLGARPPTPQRPAGLADSPVPAQRPSARTTGRRGWRAAAPPALGTRALLSGKSGSKAPPLRARPWPWKQAGLRPPLRPAAAAGPCRPACPRGLRAPRAGQAGRHPFASARRPCAIAQRGPPGSVPAGRVAVDSSSFTELEQGARDPRETPAQTSADERAGCLGERLCGRRPRGALGGRGVHRAQPRGGSRSRSGVHCETCGKPVRCGGGCWVPPPAPDGARAPRSLNPTEPHGAHNPRSLHPTEPHRACAPRSPCPMEPAPHRAPRTPQSPRPVTPVTGSQCHFRHCPPSPRSASPRLDLRVPLAWSPRRTQPARQGLEGGASQSATFASRAPRWWPKGWSAAGEGHVLRALAASRGPACSLSHACCSVVPTGRGQKMPRKPRGPADAQPALR